MIRLAVSPMPIGRTPGCLSRAISRQASSGAMDYEVPKGGCVLGGDGLVGGGGGLTSKVATGVTWWRLEGGGGC